MAVDKISNQMIGYHIVAFEGTTPSDGSAYNTTVPGLYSDSGSPLYISMKVPFNAPHIKIV